MQYRILSIFFLVLIPAAQQVSQVSAATTSNRYLSKNLGLNPQEQKRYDELMDSANSHLSKGILALRLSILVIAFIFVKSGYNVFGKGFNVSANRNIVGKPAQAIAVVLVLIGVTLAIGGWISVPLLVQ